MKIRCNSCYKVLNNDEEWCTRCGAHSDEVEKNLKEGIIPIDESEIGKKSVLFFLLVAFVVNGFLDVLFGLIFESIHSGYNLGDVGQNLPLAMTYFSSINSLLITGLIMIPVTLIFNMKDLMDYLKFDFNKKNIISLIMGIIVIIIFVLLMKYSTATVIPVYIKDFLVNPTSEMKIKGSVNLVKVLVVLISFAFVEEVIFRKAIINWFDQTTILADGYIIDIQAIFSTVLSVLCFQLLVSTSITNYLIFICCNLAFHTFLGHMYFKTNRNILFNLILRVVFIILLVVIL